MAAGTRVRDTKSERTGQVVKRLDEEVVVVAWGDGSRSAIFEARLEVVA